MKITDIAHSAQKAREGVKFFYDDQKTMGAVLRGFGAEYQAARAAYDIAYELQVQAATAAKDHAELVRIETEVVGKALADYIVVSVFDEDGEITDRDRIEYLMNDPNFKQLRSWIIQKANDHKSFPLSEQEILEIAGKLRPGTVGGGNGKPKA